jgi:methylmalonyl-CoA mutase N-terminal domain/subunit
MSAASTTTSPVHTEPDTLQAAQQRWEATTLARTLARMPESRSDFTTVSLRPIQRLYTPNDLPDFDYVRDLGFPGEFPYTRGIHATGYRGKLWTMRQFAGFGSPEDTNQRFRYLLEQGQTGLSVAFDLPTLMGYDADSPFSLGEVGKCGVSVSSLADMETLFAGIPLEKVTTSMTINAPASVIFAMFIVTAEKQGADLRKVSGTLQNDILKEYIAQKEWIYPPRPAMRLVTDSIAFCVEHMPKFNPVSVSGYHIREAGATAAQELAFTLRDGIEYVQACIEAGLNVDDFAPRLSFFFNAHNDFFEEIAKYRAARRLWARIMRERFGAQQERSWMLRFHAQTAGCTLTAQQPYNNVVRVAIQALAAVLGGTQSLHTNSLDETLALPSEQAATIALRTQQIIAHETGVTNTIDPLGGSYFVEKLTNDLEAEALDYIRRIDAMGGMVAAIEAGFPQKEIQEASYQYQKVVDSREKIIVGVNGYTQSETQEVPLLLIDERAEQAQRERLAALRAQRDNAAVKRALQALAEGARTNANTMPLIIEAVRTYATLGEICDCLRPVFGEYQEPAF